MAYVFRFPADVTDVIYSMRDPSNWNSDKYCRGSARDAADSVETPGLSPIAGGTRCTVQMHHRNENGREKYWRGLWHYCPEAMLWARLPDWYTRWHIVTDECLVLPCVGHAARGMLIKRLRKQQEMLGKMQRDAREDAA